MCYAQFMRRTYYILICCFILICISYAIQRATLQTTTPSLVRGVLEAFYTNEGVVYPRQKLYLNDFPKLSARAYMAVFDDGKNSKQLISYNADERMPIASITKLATVMVALNSSASLIDQFSETAISGAGSLGRYTATDTLPVSELVKSMLVESDNDAARVVCENESSNFVNRMNSFAQNIGARSTVFYNCTGLDGENGGTNLSTAHDTIELMRSVVRLRPELLLTMGMPSATILNSDGSLHHVAISTYEVFGTGLPFSVMGGKTGQTDLAKQNLVLALKVPKGVLYLSVLGSDDRFSDMKKLTEYVYNSFEW